MVKGTATLMLSMSITLLHDMFTCMNGMDREHYWNYSYSQFSVFTFIFLVFTNTYEINYVIEYVQTQELDRLKNKGQ